MLMDAADPGARVLLAQWVGQRDETALAGLIEANRGMVTAVCRRILGGGAEAYDTANEVFADLARDADRIHGAPGAWLRQAATHRALRQTRRRRYQRLHPEAPVVASPTRPWTEDAGDGRRRVLEAALGMLSPEQRSAVVRRFLLARPTQAIAEEDGISAGAVRRRLAAALHRLRHIAAVHSWDGEVCGL